ncbi:MULTISPECIES: preprotein translocase subunit SecE [unclassified Corynebacterium]|uniref:preprotein translocase subunit SecE n=1 Tax=unclassified Corynebacterium TaxID=2624378 RepID=UPI0029CA580D|nr:MULTISPECIES: preprotein translocase subunit SecE [unclassified Corynebacterium]WPF66445.1 preprotein translocase subunit SecE [Corynebacterium sp. 22KM0430]WPF68935.1 preprotein translocase subunit SecE [Corynebacterium sp. 21KM1197]
MSEDRANQTGAAQPTGKRQRTGASTTTTSSYEAQKSAPQSPEDTKPGGGPLRFLPEVGAEIKKVIWPTASQMVTYTLVVFAFLIVLTALVSGVDFVVGLGVEKVLAP